MTYHIEQITQLGTIDTGISFWYPKHIDKYPYIYLDTTLQNRTIYIPFSEGIYHIEVISIGSVKPIGNWMRSIMMHGYNNTTEKNVSYNLFDVGHPTQSRGWIEPHYSFFISSSFQLSIKDIELIV